MSVSNSCASAAWPTLPSLGNLDAYIRAVQAIPMLDVEEEQALARRLRDQQDLQAASKLVLSHLRLVVSMSRQYLGYGLPQGDLIQEGSIGLMKAVKRFDPDQGVRLVSYAMYWIKAEIHEYILKNWRMVKVATTKAQRKLFFNLRSLKHQLKGEADDVHVTRAGMSEAEIRRVAQELDVRPEDVIEMESRMAGGDVVIDISASEGDDESHLLNRLPDLSAEPTRMIESNHRAWLASDGIKHALTQLDDRSRRIIEERWLKVNDDGSGGMTLHELAADYGVSAERIRQIEAKALTKMRGTMA